MQPDPDRPRDSTPVQRVDPGAHRRRDDEGEEEQADHELELPQRQRKGDYSDEDDRGDERAAGCVLHL